MSIRDLLEKRASLVSEMRQITTQANGDGGDLSAEQSTKFDALKTQLETVEKTIERQRLVDEAERRMAGAPLTNGDKRFETECRQVSLQKAIACQIDPRVVDAGREIEISAELAKRSGRKPQGIFIPLEALVERRVLTAAGDGANLIQTDVLANEFIDALRPAAVVTRLGARVLTGLRGNISLPKMDALTPAAEWIDYNDTSGLTGGDHSLTAVTGTPHLVGCLTSYDRRTMLQSDPSIESIARSDFTQKIGAAVDLAALAGTGSSTAVPEGITNNGDVHTIATVAAPAYADLSAAVALVEASNVPMTNLGWAANPWIRSTLQQTPRLASDTTGTSGFCMGEDNRLLGFPFITTSQLAGDPLKSPTPDPGELIFGAWNQVIVAFFGDGVDILVDPYTELAKGNIRVRAFVDCDVLIRHGEAFTYLSGITLTAPPAGAE